MHNQSHTEETKSVIADKMRAWAKTAEGKEHYKKASQRMLEYAKTDAGKEHYAKMVEAFRNREITDEERKKRSESNTGSNNPKWSPFDLVVTLPNNSKEVYRFDGERPFSECADRFGLTNQMALLKKGEQYTVKVVKSTTKHHWPKNTIIKMVLLTQ